MRKAIIIIAISIIMALMIIARIMSPSNLKVQSKKGISTSRLHVYIFLEIC